MTPMDGIGMLSAGGLVTTTGERQIILAVVLFVTPTLTGLLGLAWATLRTVRGPGERSRERSTAEPESQGRVIAFFVAWVLAGLVLAGAAWTQTPAPLPTPVVVVVLIGAPVAAAFAVVLAVDWMSLGYVSPIATTGIVALVVGTTGPLVWMYRNSGIGWWLVGLAALDAGLLLLGWKMAKEGGLPSADSTGNG